MFNTVVVVLERATSVVWRIDIDTLDFPGELLLKGLQCEQVVSEDQPIVENVRLRNALLGVVGLVNVFQENPRLQLRAVLFADPRQFELRFLSHGFYRLPCQRPSHCKERLH